MNKEISKWLRNIGFEEDRSYLHVWQYRTEFFPVSSEREARLCFELSSKDENSYSVCVTLEAEGSKPENYSCGSLWLFTENGSDVKELFKKCLSNLTQGFMPFIMRSLEKLFGVMSN